MPRNPRQASRADRVAAQVQSMLAAASGKPIQLQEATFGSPLPGGPAYGAVRDGRQVLVQRGAAGAGGNYGSVNFAGQTLDPLTIGKDVMWVPRGGQPTEIERRYGIGARTAEPPSTVEPPAQDPLVLRDDVDARASEATRMLQQATPFWEREENKALKVAAGPVSQGGGPRAGEAGYAQRADISAWIEANKDAPKGADGKNIVDRFLEQQRAKGLLDTPGSTGGMGTERIAMPADAESAAQAGQRGLVGFDGTALQQAQANVNELQGRERDARTRQIWQAAADGKLPDLVAAGSIPGNLKTDWANYSPSDQVLTAYAGTDLGIPATEVLRGAPLTASGDPTEALAPGSNRPGQPQAGYGGATVADVFNGPAALPSQSTTAGMTQPDTGMTPVREQGVPGLTEPPPSPLSTRDRNLNPATELVNAYLGRARLYTQGGLR